MMEKVQYNIIWVLIFLLFGALIYWGLTHLGDGRVSGEYEQYTYTSLYDSSGNGSDDESDIPTVAVDEPKQDEEKPAPASTTNKYPELVASLQKLVDDGVVMKKGSQGTRVGTVQKFLNIYFDTNNTVDNDFGAGTDTRIREFQKDQGVTADGQAGPGTYKKMITWLQQQ